MSQPNRLAADAAHQFGGIELDRSKPLSFRFDGRRIEGFAGDTVLSALLANGIDTIGLHAGSPLGLTAGFVPLAGNRKDPPLPIDRLPALDGLDLMTVGTRRGLPFGQAHSLRLDLATRPEPPWLRPRPDTALTADMLVIGGGVAGLAAALAASDRGLSVILAERRPWLGGDARYFGAVGDEETPEALTTRLIANVAARANVTVLTSADVFALAGTTATVHHIEIVDGVPRGRVIAATAPRVTLATGAMQRLPIFPGNRLPGVLTTMAAYHLAKRYGVVRGRSAVVSTQSNHGYRLALRLHDAGVAIRRIVDTRINPQSRFVDFAKASGLTIASGESPAAAARTRGTLHLSLTDAFGKPAAGFDATQIIVSGGWQAELTLWTLAGGGVVWSPERSGLVATGRLDAVVLAGAAAGLKTMQATAESGRAAIAALSGETPAAIDDTEPGAHIETPDGRTPQAPEAETPPSYFAVGASLVARPANAAAARNLTIGDVAASVELGLIAAGDAGAVAEERGAPGAELAASGWTPTAGTEPVPDYLHHRFGNEPVRVHLVVDHRRRFETGALVYSAGGKPDPEHAIGVIVDAAPIGGIALIAKSALKRDPRFIVELATGASPARLATPPGGHSSLPPP